MNEPSWHRPKTGLRTPAGPVLAVMAVAVGTGALAGLAGAGFIWLLEVFTEGVWTTLPESLPAGLSRWWVVAVPVAGGVLVGLGQRHLGNHPKPLSHLVDAWRSGGGMRSSDTPAAAANSFSALVAGGPLGVESALVGVIGGVGAWAGDRIGAAGRVLRQAWGVGQEPELPWSFRRLPPWLAAMAGILAFRAAPFGSLHFGVELPDAGGRLTTLDALTAFGVALLVVGPVGWLHRLVVAAEEQHLFARAPVLLGSAAGLAVGVLALGSDLVLFSGQAGLNRLGDIGTFELAYAAVAKATALVLVYLGGWRGGPMFPLWFIAAATGMLASDLVGLEPSMAVVGGMATVGVVFLRGQVAGAVLLTMLVAPFSLFGPVVVATVGAAAGWALMGPAAVAPSLPPDGHPGAGQRQDDEGGGSGDGPDR